MTVEVGSPVNVRDGVVVSVGVWVGDEVRDGVYVAVCVAGCVRVGDGVGVVGVQMTG
jgi:hypothetical protein